MVTELRKQIFQLKGALMIGQNNCESLHHDKVNTTQIQNRVQYMVVKVGDVFGSKGGEHCYYPNPYIMQVVEVDEEGTVLRYRSWDNGDIRSDLSHVVFRSSVVDDIDSGLLVRITLDNMHEYQIPESVTI